MKKAPEILNKIVDVVLAYRPASKSRKRKKKKGVTMNYEVSQDNEFPNANEWRCDAIDTKSGDIYAVIFGGTDAEQRAREYASWQQSLTRAA
jgi:hypothetical protein